MPRLTYVPEVDDALPPSRPATLIRIPADAFKSKAALRAALRGDPNTTSLGPALSSTAVAAAGSDGKPLKPYKRSRPESEINASAEDSPVPSFKPLRPIRTTRAGRPVRTYTKFHWN